MPILSVLIPAYNAEGTVEADETFVGGAARFMHKHKREEKIHGRGPMGKEIVFGLLERKTGRVRVQHVGTIERDHRECALALEPQRSWHYLPLNCGLRLFTNASTPSFLSSVANSR